MVTAVASVVEVGAAEVVAVVAAVVVVTCFTVVAAAMASVVVTAAVVGVLADVTTVAQVGVKRVSDLTVVAAEVVVGGGVLGDGVGAVVSSLWHRYVGHLLMRG